MKIELHEITIKEITEGYINNDEEGGVIGYSGKLNIRPKYQREFVYKGKKRDAVIETIRKDFPLNVMYWVINDEGTYEVLDGQQRTVSICEYVIGNFSVAFEPNTPLAFHNLQNNEQAQILDYTLMIYFCEGNDKEKLDWFKIINIAGEKLTDQELRNAIYTGTWLTAAKKYFSKTGCAAYGMASDYMKGTAIRQEYLETAISWISNNKIAQYMADHQQDPNANDLWLYFQNVISWVKVLFPKYRKEMKGLPFGVLYNKYKDKQFDAVELEKEVVKLMQDEDVTKKAGIYTFVITRDDKVLNIRAFSDNQKREAYERQEGVCPKCKEKFESDKMEADHITPWSKGGKTIADNCQMLCEHDNRMKSNQ